MDRKGKIASILAISALVVGGILGVVGFVSMDNEPANPDASDVKATLTMGEIEDSNSTEIRGVYVVKSGDSATALNDNLEADPDSLVVASFTSSGGTAEVDWGTEYQVIGYSYGEENEVSNDVANIRLGWDGDYWGDGDGSVLMPDENSDEEYQLTETDDGVAFTGDTFTVDGDTHIAVNYLGNSTGFTLDRDETASLNEILLQAYF